MKKFKSLLLFCLFLWSGICFTSCNRDDDDSNQDNNPTINFIDQDLQGVINERNWRYKQGNVVTRKAFEYDDDGVTKTDSGYQHWFNILAEEKDSCSTISTDGSAEVFFILTNRDERLEAGFYPLKLNFNQSQNVNQFDNTNLTVTLIYEKDGVPTNIVCSTGQLEILNVDEAESLITGRLATEGEGFGEFHFINGNFELKYCEPTF